MWHCVTHALLTMFPYAWLAAMLDFDFYKANHTKSKRATLLKSKSNLLATSVPNFMLLSIFALSTQNWPLSHSTIKRKSKSVWCDDETKDLVLKKENNVWDTFAGMNEKWESISNGKSTSIKRKVKKKTNFKDIRIWKWVGFLSKINCGKLWKRVWIGFVIFRPFIITQTTPPCSACSI